MAVTIALLIGGFVWLFATINPYLSDFIGAEAAPTGTATAVAQAANTEPAEGGQAPPTAEPTVAPTREPTTAPSEEPTVAPTETPEDEFQADYEVAGGGGAINYRNEPGTDGTESVAVLDPGTPLQSTGEEETVNGAVWLEFVNEDGLTGWIREIDVEPVDAAQ